jgi:RNA polymerase sigma factor (TIGR02999 family)
MHRDGHTVESSNIHGPRDPTALLLAWSRGDQAAFDELVPLIHDELHRIARRHMRLERAGHTLQATALVNEAYLRLIDVKQMKWQNRAHFLAMAARVMRRILVDSARARRFQKRGGGARVEPLDQERISVEEPSRDLVALDDALTALASIDPRKSRVVEMRFFGGLTNDETAEVLHVSAETVRRDWRLAKAWLLGELTP